MKKWMLIALAGVMLGLVAGCSKKPDEQESGFKNDKPVAAEDGGGAKPGEGK